MPALPLAAGGGAILKEAFEFGHEFLDVFEIEIDRGEADVGDFVEAFEAGHEEFAEFGGGALALGGFVDEAFGLFDQGFEFALE